MTQNKRELWLRLKAYQFEGLVPRGLGDVVASMFGREKTAAAHAFAAKVARKRGWTEEYARRVVEEYKKYVYLGLISSTNVTPPDPIDRVWHQHILFSKGYRAFEEDVLHRDFDHRPELVHDEAQTKLFAQQYNATLALYAKEFGVPPPEDIWGKPKFDPSEVRDAQPVIPRREDRDKREPREKESLSEVVDELKDPLTDLLEEVARNRRSNFPEFFPAPEPVAASSPTSDGHDSHGKGHFSPSYESTHHDSGHSHSHHSDSGSHTASDSGGGGHSCSSGGSSCSSASCASCGGGGD